MIDLGEGGRKEELVRWGFLQLDGWMGEVRKCSDYLYVCQANR